MGRVDLLRRLREGGTHGRLDREMFEAAGVSLREYDHHGQNWLGEPYTEKRWKPRGFRWQILGNDGVTYITDAALALMKQVLPEWRVDFIQQSLDEDYWTAGIYRRGDDRKIERAAGDGPTAPLAICAAILRALPAAARPNETEGEGRS